MTGCSEQHLDLLKWNDDVFVNLTDKRHFSLLKSAIWSVKNIIWHNHYSCLN